MDKDGTFYALSTDKGRVQWKRKIGSLNASAPAYADGRLFAVSLEPHQAVALRPNEHGSKVLWRHPLPGRSESSPLIHDGKVIFGCESGDIFALDEKTGKTRWTVSTAGPVKGGLAFNDGTVFAGNYAGEIYAIDASNGQVKWTAHTQGGGLLRGGGVYSTPAVAWGRVYLGSLDGRIYSFVEKTGELAWSHSTGAEVYPSPAVADTPHSPADRLRRLAGQALLRARRPHRRAALGAPGRRGRARILQRGRRDRLRLDDRAEHRHLRLRRQERQEGLRERPGRVQPGDLGRREDLPHRGLDDPRLQAGAEPAAAGGKHRGGARTEAASRAEG